MRLDKDKDRIKEALMERAMQVEPSEDLFHHIRKEIYDKERNGMLKKDSGVFMNRRKLTTVIAMGLMIASVTVVGASLTKSWVTQTNQEYKQFPSKQQLLEDVGFTPKYVEVLPGEFTFIDGGYGESRVIDEAGEIVEVKDQVTLYYAKDDAKNPIALTMIEQNEDSFGLDSENTLQEPVGSVEGIELYYASEVYKFVPEEYVLTTEDEQAIEDGTMMLSYGTDDVSVQNMQTLGWYEEGVAYSLIGFDYGFSTKEMIAMAEAIIIEVE